MAGTGDLCSCLRSASDASCCPLLWAGWAGCLAVGQQNVENKPRGSGEAKRTERQKERLPEQPCSPGSPVFPGPPGLQRPARLPAVASESVRAGPGWECGEGFWKWRRQAGGLWGGPRSSARWWGRRAELLSVSGPEPRPDPVCLPS